ncbi:dual specificity protein phosphatase 23 isoform X1 [Falco rusticolus]|uniref:dual specificity protein phosphatase 23 isoform X1 n=2 Tax=Falco rusticolus TaxID=120794 RepID=UPI000FFBC25D|nr:dual specificity protein phosphatase 23 isoform X1 [Falco rusticolus]
MGIMVMGASEPPNFSWVAEGRLAGLAMPRQPGHYRFLLGQGVRHLVSLSERAPPHHGCCPDIQLHRLRVPDFSPPTPRQIQSFLQLVEEANACGEAVAVHCMLGHGRTGTMLACYLVKAQKMNGSDAIREIRRLRPGSIETREQEQAVIQFYQHIRTEEDSKV